MIFFYCCLYEAFAHRPDLQQLLLLRAGEYRQFNLALGPKWRGNEDERATYRAVYTLYASFTAEQRGRAI